MGLSFKTSSYHFTELRLDKAYMFEEWTDILLAVRQRVSKIVDHEVMSMSEVRIFTIALSSVSYSTR